MAEIFDFSLAKKRKAEGKSPVPRKEGVFLTADQIKEQIKEDILSKLKLLDVVLAMKWTPQEAGERKEYMLKATEEFNPRTLETLRKEVRNYNNFELARHFLESAGNQWSAKPTFYKAIIEEIEDRVHHDI